MIEGGKGGAKTLTGLDFEQKIELRNAFTKFKEYTIKNDDLLYNGKVVANMYKKDKFYKKFLEPRGIDVRKILSKKLLPDDALFIILSNTLFIVEMKFQKVAGSVDEKLQTCDFKRKQYQRLLSGTEIRVEYVYILNDWFKDFHYKDVLDYIKGVGCHYFFEELPFSFLGLPEPEN
ncbi:MAG: hypothetical protein AABX11_01885 [Nanoarchaeota archaeon]